MMNLFKSQLFLWLVGLGIALTQTVSAQSITINANDNLNDHADQVGIWVNNWQDTKNADYVNRLQDLNVQSIRYGWMYGVFDKNNTGSKEHSPCDPNVQGFIATSGCRMNEKFGPQGVADLLDDLNVDGVGVISFDGINYTSNVDANLSSKNKDQRSDFYEQRAKDWVNWAKNNRFSEYEIGNESDFTHDLDKSGAGTKWTPADYAKYAKQMAQAVKSADANARVGINGGGLNGDDADRAWFDGIYAQEPNINNNIDFVITHKYENWMFWDTYKDTDLSISWNFGRLSSGVRDSKATHFPNVPIYVTEIGAWSTTESENVYHYRGVLNCEMIGNVFMDDYVHLAHVWPTTWNGYGMMSSSPNYDISAQGNGMKAYTKFMQPRMVANGYSGAVRYFASKDPSTNEITVWIINRGETSQNPNITINNFGASTNNQLWRLTSSGNDPYATSNSLYQDGSATVTQSGTSASFSISCNPVSVTIVKFDAADGSGSNDDYLRIKNKATGLYMRPDNSGDDASIYLSTDDGTDWFKWEKVANGSYFYLKNKQTGKYFRPATSTDGSLMQQKPTSWNGTWTQWEEIVSSDGDNVHLKNRATGKYIRPKSSSDTNVELRPSSWSGDWTRWSLEGAGSGGGGASGEITSTSWNATAYSSFAGYPPSNMIDTNTGSRWVSGASMTTSSWVQLDMLSSQTVDRIKITSMGSNYPDGYRIYISNTSGSGGTQVADVASNSNVDIDHSFSAISGRYIRVEVTASKGDWWDIYDFQVFGPTGSRFGEEVDLQVNNISIYPNPAENLLQLSGEPDGLISILDLSGKTVLEFSASDHNQMDVSTLDAGVYFVEFRTGSATQRLKLLKK